MIPLRDSIPSRRFPVVTVALIVVNALAFFHELGLGERRLANYLMAHGVVPVLYTDSELRHAVLDVAGWRGLIQPLFSSMFLHGGWAHIIGNLWILWIFGDNVEDRLGRFRYLLFYLASGVVAALLHIVTNWHSELPTIGASGAIAGVMGAYFLLFPHARVQTLVILGFLVDIVTVPAVIFLGLWFLLQVFSGTLGLFAGTGAGGIAWWAHIGGFAFGALMIKLLARRPPRRFEDWNW
ncbi:MAG: rhomboid family intramembrane serine protease [Verrucomicrobiae bacterium]|nr:rhomboid family intramembrane serine protease [Verrucomicrobiae bacterium]